MREFKPNPLLVIISGPSGVGKDTVLKAMKAGGFPFHFVVTMTTRPPRPGEVNGEDYIFVSEEEFNKALRSGALLENAVVYGHHYGVPKEQVRKAVESGKDVLMRVDVQGARTLRGLIPEAVFIFLVPSSEEELLRRLKIRHTEDEEALKLRLSKFREEMESLSEFDYVVVNADGKLDETVQTILAIIKAEKCRTKQRKVQIPL
ncbi:MAG: guanylate kinase [Chloroflexi bacterium]|nr:MAG: guanylate kinase [Chloroflexota bacterium]